METDNAAKQEITAKSITFIFMKFPWKLQQSIYVYCHQISDYHISVPKYTNILTLTTTSHKKTFTSLHVCFFHTIKYSQTYRSCNKSIKIKLGHITCYWFIIEDFRPHLIQKKYREKKRISFKKDEKNATVISCMFLWPSSQRE